MTSSPPTGAGRRLAWLAFLYLASGLPNGLVTGAAPLLYKASHIDLKAIGLLAVVELPWILKFLWAPALDRWGGRKTWIASCQVALVGLLAAFAFLPSDSVPPLAWACLLGMAFASATQDVAIDAYSIEVVPPDQVGPANGVRVTAYRIALVLAGGTLVGRAPALGWTGVWLLAAAAFVPMALATLVLPTTPPRPRPDEPPLAPFLSLARRPGFLAFALFVLLFKIGDYLMARMTKPCLLDRGFGLEEIGDWVTPMEIGATILGAILGGLATKRMGVFRALWVLGLFQAASNLGYAFGADHGKPALWAAAAIEPFCTGLGTAPFLSLLMLSCERSHAATQFAVLTAIMGLGRILAGVASGYGADRMGYAAWFALTFVAALPALALLPAVRRWLADCGARRVVADLGSP